MIFPKHLLTFLALALLLLAPPLYADTTDPSATPDDEVEQTETTEAEDAADAEEDEEVAEEPTYNNAAQAMHAANLAQTAALEPNPETEEARDALQDAREDYHTAKEDLLANPDDPLAQEAFETAKDNLLDARQTYADAVAELAGVLGEDIYGMRAGGMGWGAIAHELGIHPGTLGLGHGKKKKGNFDPVDDVIGDIDAPDTDSEIAEATQRNKITGWSAGHGLAAGRSKKSGSGLGLTTTSGASSGNKGGVGNGNKSGNSGNSSASGNSGNSGNSRDSSGSPSGNSNKGGNGKGNDKGDKGNNGKGKGKK